MGKGAEAPCPPSLQCTLHGGHAAFGHPALPPLLRRGRMWRAVNLLETAASHTVSPFADYTSVVPFTMDAADRRGIEHRQVGE